MMIATKNIVILHQSALQVDIWQRILQSQGLTAIALPFSTDLRGELLDLEANQSSLPNLILLEQNLPSFDTEKFCRWMQTRDQPVPILLLAAQFHRVEAFDRQAAIQAGALDLLPQFDIDTIAIEAVNGLKCVAKALGNINIVNNTLVSCIMELKREIEVDPFQSSPPSPNPTPIAIAAQNPSQNMFVSPQTQPPPKPTKIRKYRGRDY